RNFTILRRILETPATDASVRQAADYYAACVDEAAIERQGLGALEPELRAVARLDDRKDLPALLARLHGVIAGAGSMPLFQFGSRQDLRDATSQIAQVDEDGLGLPDRDYYLKTDEASVALRRKYQEHVGRMLEFSEMPAADAVSNAAAILTLETQLAGAAIPRATRRDPAAVDHMMT